MAANHPAFGAGSRARFDGQPSTANPYPIGSTAYRAWAKGWNEINAKLGSGR
ncbi:ribosome modulation factor [Sphingomonas changnyeongensis]|uniref:ribosome modulation factor n=1 Tax=Sphingomonas changnyeongensis TaxID=2698679 RepID=UPI00191BD61A|nr:hypothetical protein [Sphingomonas changnyeongensis]